MSVQPTNSKRRMGERSATYLLRMQKQGIDGLRCAYPSYACFPRLACASYASLLVIALTIFFQFSLHPCFSKNLKLDDNKSLSKTTISPVSSVGPVMTKSYVFGFIYLATTNFDLCNEQKTGQEFREILENYFQVCISGTDDATETLAIVRETTREIDASIAKNRNDALSQAIDDKEITSCKDFLSSLGSKKMAEIVKRDKIHPIKWQVPRDCNLNYDWISR